jgi:hypothetical protein
MGDFPQGSSSSTKHPAGNPDFGFQKDFQDSDVGFLLVGLYGREHVQQRQDGIQPLGVRQ